MIYDNCTDNYVTNLNFTLKFKLRLIYMLTEEVLSFSAHEKTPHSI